MSPVTPRVMKTLGTPKGFPTGRLTGLRSFRWSFCPSKLRWGLESLNQRGKAPPPNYPSIETTVFGRIFVGAKSQLSTPNHRLGQEAFDTSFGAFQVFGVVSRLGARFGQYADMKLTFGRAAGLNILICWKGCVPACVRACVCVREWVGG